MKNNLAKRIIPCLDIENRRVAKGTRFVDVKEVGDPVALAKYYEAQGADELVLYDIGASVEMRSNFLELVSEIAATINIPFTVGGGIRSANDVYLALMSGADKVSINTAAIMSPEILSESARRFGNQCIVASIDTKYTDGDYFVYIYGGRSKTPYRAVEWAIKCEALGAGELVINAIDQDGVKLGYDSALLKRITEAVNIPVIASGGAGSIQDFVDLVKSEAADAALAASVFHFKTVDIDALKKSLSREGILVRESL
ncbi:MAG TPA: imidazole glycerol phosphate synthase subunit HisF [Clostridiales bacterium UBA8960]|nr:imidazole glycerol phosphate synthase subunit HisF [Clostridiales bacterium UBA8960]